MKPTGENEMGLRKVMDLTRMIGIVVLLLHFYFSCYGAFKDWHLTHAIGDRLLQNLARTGLFDNFHKSKLITLGFVALSWLGIPGKKDEKFNYRLALAYLLTGLLLYFISALALNLQMQITTIAAAYIVITSTGFILFITGGALLTRILKLKLSGDVFNKQNETFPQEERLIENEYSVNLPTRYRLKNKIRSGWINLINGFRGTLIMGLPGSGKTLFLVENIIKQQIKKGYTMFVYDYKYPDLTTIVYNYWLQYKDHYPVTPEFYILNFDTPVHRCNPLMVDSLDDITDAAESARTILLGLNPAWIEKQGDFWVESPISFLTAVIWYLRKHDQGKYCTLPHVIELLQQPYDKLFSLLRTEPEVEALVNPFVKAYLSDAAPQLEGQMAGVTISLGKLSSPKLYYVLSGNDFNLDIGNPMQPKIVCAANNPRKAHIYGSVISLYLTVLQRLANKPGNQKSSLVLEEFSSIFFNGIDKFLAVCRSYMVAITMIIQDASQLKLHYGKEQAEVILNMVGNIISGQVTGDSAKALSDRFGKIMQDRESVAINSSDTSITRSKQLDFAIPQSTIAALSSGEVVGMVADNPDQRIELKMFHAEFVQDLDLVKQERLAFKQVPKSKTDQQKIMANYLLIKREIKDIVENEIERMVNDPELAGMIISK
ncbi:MAG: YWFCY domain-containing protein [Sphingobacteriia bacterium]|nr:YWFCY domain-containing protein [Sphingobacteriia bacterium]